jgi:hypothetical protein
MILLEPAYKIFHTSVKFKRRTISVTPFPGNSFHPRQTRTSILATDAVGFSGIRMICIDQLSRHAFAETTGSAFRSSPGTLMNWFENDT